MADPLIYWSDYSDERLRRTIRALENMLPNWRRNVSRYMTEAALDERSVEWVARERRALRDAEQDVSLMRHDMRQREGEAARKQIVTTELSEQVSPSEESRQ